MSKHGHALSSHSRIGAFIQWQPTIFYHHNLYTQIFLFLLWVYACCVCLFACLFVCSVPCAKFVIQMLVCCCCIFSYLLRTWYGLMVRHQHHPYRLLYRSFGYSCGLCDIWVIDMWLILKPNFISLLCQRFLVGFFFTYVEYFW